MSEPARWTQEEYDAHMAKFHPGRPVEACHSPAKPTAKPSAGRMQPTRGIPNKTEAAYKIFLDQLITSGGVKSYKFESVTIKLAEGCRYTPDFFVELKTGKLELHEVKRKWRNAKQRGPNMESDARVKLLTAAKLYPEFDFVLAWLDGNGGWHIEHVAK